MLEQLWHDEAGMTSVEYALMMMLVMVAALTAWSMLGTGVHDSAQASSASMPPT